MYLLCMYIYSLIRYRSKSRKLSLRSSLPGINHSDVKTDKSVTGSNNKTFKQNDDLSYHSIKSHDNTHRESKCLYKINNTKH